MIATHCMVQSYLKLDQGHAFHLLHRFSIHSSMIDLGIEKILLRENAAIGSTLLFTSHESFPTTHSAVSYYECLLLFVLASSVVLQLLDDVDKAD